MLNLQNVQHLNAFNGGGEEKTKNIRGKYGFYHEKLFGKTLENRFFNDLRLKLTLIPTVLRFLKKR